MQINKYIDNTLLKPFSKKEEIIEFTKESIKYNFASICILPCHIQYAKEVMTEQSIKIATVIGFPLGANTTEVKILETKDAILKGADEIDMVINISWAQDNFYNMLKNEIEDIYDTVKSFGEDKVLKVIIENCYLDNESIKKLCIICKEIGVDYVKTSTGFGSGGATIEDIKVMKSLLGEFPKIKAAGGIKTFEDAKEFIEAGANRLGTSNGFEIVDTKDRRDC